MPSPYPRWNTLWFNESYVISMPGNDFILFRSGWLFEFTGLKNIKNISRV